MTEQSGVVSSENQLISVKQRLSVKLKESVNNVKPDPIDRHQSSYHQSSNALLATNSLALAATKEHKIIHK